ncbi:DUF262 domain-containing protein [Vibrio scophthalmi]|uniref:GmrSD restriction endonucleases N-terminal domain-containing protein n=1 Tax=Vibrio scophthalmi TaxID=45658 RepID=A0A1E3WG63_9VIBR|nr:DUF262 domain-containing protein [Vibrio scophthalmi]ODS04740.1 hypothetical protein VSF3289_03879 [Vibrio scophthalmi]
MSENSSGINNENQVSLFEEEHKVEYEDSGNPLEVHPWDPEKIRITTKHFSLREVVDQILDGDIDLSPDFQREYVWSDKQKTRLVESVLLGIPLPAFYFNQEIDGSYQIVDGVQRLSTISAFMRDFHCLRSTHLEYLKDYDGMKFSDLGTLETRRFRSTQIVVHVIEPTTPTDIKYDIFSRVNTLGSPLKPQEIRHAMSTSRSRNFLSSFVENKYFDEATDFNFWKKGEDGKPVRNSGRMTDREIALRFCAFKTSSLDEYREFSSLDRFLVNFTERLDGKSSETAISDEEMDALLSSFERAMEAATYILGDSAFRRIEDGKRRGPINRAIFESQSIALSAFPLDQLLDKSNEVREILIGLFQDPDYTKSVTVGTGAPNSVKTRITVPIVQLMELLNDQ